MDDPFPRSRQSLAADSFRLGPPAAVVLVLLAGAWLGWATLGRVGVYAVSRKARVESAGSAQPVEAATGGRLARVHVALGDRVQAGQALFEIEASDDEVDVAQLRSRLLGLKRQLPELGQQEASQRRAFEQQLAAADAKLAAARSAVREAEEAASFARERATRQADLHAQGLVSDEQLSEARARSGQLDAAVQAARASAASAESERDALVEGFQVSRAELERERARLEGETAEAEDAVEHERSRRLVVAPMGGTIEELGELQAGAVVAAGDRLATIVPPGDVRVVAWFTPADALGRIAPGQAGRMRLDGFPWTRYGTLGVSVVRRSGEPRSGQVRVELEVLSRPPGFEVTHGLEGSVEIEVERLSPIALALRAAGRRGGGVSDSGG
jgi:membrane fusion protein (multidrug efflux system)